MLAQTDDASRNNLPYMANVAEIPQDETPDDFARLLRDLMDAYGRAVQCLRDVRHQLPPAGVATVDAVLDYAAV
jgi:hypothetical protein